MEKNNDMIASLKQTGMELYLRCESWKSALLQIERVNQDPIIARMIKRALNQETA